LGEEKETRWVEFEVDRRWVEGWERRIGSSGVGSGGESEGKCDGVP
jgi:hypothetical protein